MNTVAGVLSPPLLAVFAVLSLGFGALLFFMARRSDAVAIENDAPLSWAEPIEVRLVLYLMLAAICGTAALIIRLIFGFTSVGAFAGSVLLVLTGLGFLCNLAFLYAAGGSLLQGALGTRGRPPFWLWRFMSPIDGIVMDAGDVLARMLFHPAPPRERRRRQRAYEYDEDYDYDRPPRARSAGGCRSRHADDDEYEFDSPPPRRREPAPYVEDSDRFPPRRREYLDDSDRLPPRRREPAPYMDEPDHLPPRRREPAPYAEAPERAPRRPVFEGDIDAGDVEEYAPADDGAAARPRSRRTRRTQQDILRERLEMAMRDYESALTPTQREKLREMRSIIESITQMR
jgi:hypothetical protein